MRDSDYLYLIRNFSRTNEQLGNKYLIQIEFHSEIQPLLRQSPKASADQLSEYSFSDFRRLPSHTGGEGSDSDDQPFDDGQPGKFLTAPKLTSGRHDPHRTIL